MKSESDSHSPSAEPIALDAPLSARQRASIDAVLEQLRELPGALLPILHAIQDALGFVPPSAVPLIANSLNLSRADVHGVISFYHDFRNTAPGRHRLQLCRAEACQAVGARALERHVCERLQVNQHETTTNNAVSLEPVYCLGNCASGPSLMLDGRLHGRMTPARIDRLLDALDASDAGDAQ
ncbi:MAG: formate dehydrogenase subunit gamma [Dokdonella sp.]